MRMSTSKSTSMDVTSGGRHQDKVTVRRAERWQVKMLHLSCFSAAIRNRMQTLSSLEK